MVTIISIIAIIIIIIIIIIMIIILERRCIRRGSWSRGASWACAAALRDLRVDVKYPVGIVKSTNTSLILCVLVSPIYSVSSYTYLLSGTKSRGRSVSAWGRCGATWSSPIIRCPTVLLSFSASFLERETVKIHQRGVQWKQGVVVYINYIIGCFTL